MTTRTDAAAPRHTGLLDRFFARLYEHVHGPEPMTPRETHEAMWTKLAELELAAAELEATVDVERARMRQEDEPPR